VIALDPNARGLRAATRYERSEELLQAEIRRFDQCQPGSTITDPARQAVAGHPRPSELEDSADENLTLAEGLWKQGQKLCGTKSAAALNPDDQAIERVLARLSRQ
jgi:hypothetical protein